MAATNRQAITVTRRARAAAIAATRLFTGDPNAGRQFDPRLVHLVATSDAIRRLLGGEAREEEASHLRSRSARPSWAARRTLRVE